MAQKSNTEESEKTTAAFVKVCMDGAPYLRKVDLKMYKSYQELSDALAKMFSSFTNGKYRIYTDSIKKNIYALAKMFNSFTDGKYRIYIDNIKINTLSCI